MVFLILFTLAMGTSPKDAREAERLVKQSIVEYNVGDFDAALADVTKAYKLRPAPALLFNIGQCHRALHNWEKAAFFYRGYLREKPDATNREKVEALIEEMQQKQKADSVSAVAPPPAVVAAPAAAAPLAAAPAAAIPAAAPLSVTLSPPPPPTPALSVARPVPVAAVEAPPAPTKPEGHHPSGAAIGFGIATLAATAVAVVGAAILIDFQSYRSGLQPGTTIYAPDYAAKQSQAKTWQVVTPVAAGVAAGCLTGTVLTW
jgi:tetratricopeptide (TPR) repeat protein